MEDTSTLNLSGPFCHPHLMGVDASEASVIEFGGAGFHCSPPVLPVSHLPIANPIASVCAYDPLAAGCLLYPNPVPLILSDSSSPLRGGGDQPGGPKFSSRRQERDKPRAEANTEQSSEIMATYNCNGPCSSESRKRQEAVHVDKAETLDRPDAAAPALLSDADVEDQEFFRPLHAPLPPTASPPPQVNTENCACRVTGFATPVSTSHNSKPSTRQRKGDFAAAHSDGAEFAQRLLEGLDAQHKKEQAQGAWPLESTNPFFGSRPTLEQRLRPISMLVTKAWPDLNPMLPDQGQTRISEGRISHLSSTVGHESGGVDSNSAQSTQERSPRLPEAHRAPELIIRAPNQYHRAQVLPQLVQAQHIARTQLRASEEQRVHDEQRTHRKRDSAVSKMERGPARAQQQAILNPYEQLTMQSDHNGPRNQLQRWGSTAWMTSPQALNTCCPRGTARVVQRAEFSP